MAKRSLGKKNRHLFNLCEQMHTMIIIKKIIALVGFSQTLFYIFTQLILSLNCCFCNKKEKCNFAILMIIFNNILYISFFVELNFFFCHFYYNNIHLCYFRIHIFIFIFSLVCKYSQKSISIWQQHSTNAL